MNAGVWLAQPKPGERRWPDQTQDACRLCDAVGALGPRALPSTLPHTETGHQEMLPWDS